MSIFNIVRQPSEPNIEERPLDLQQYETDYASIDAQDVPESWGAELYILPKAFEEIKAHISWRAQTMANRYEQGGILIGDVYKNPETQVVYGLVTGVIPSPRSGDETYIQFTHDSWREMYQALDRKKSAAPDGGQMRLLGWYHTHPNMRVVMSNVDQNTHRQFFSKYWQFSVIFNPQYGIWSVFNGANCRNCYGRLFCPQADFDMEPYTRATALVAQEWRPPQPSVVQKRPETGTNSAIFKIKSRTYNQPEQTQATPPPQQPVVKHRPGNNKKKDKKNRKNDQHNLATNATSPFSSPEGRRIPANLVSNVAQSAVNAVQTAVDHINSLEPYIFSKRLYPPSIEKMRYIQREFVEQFTHRAKLPSYIDEKNELILLYPLNPHPGDSGTPINGERYYSFESHSGSSIKATGFWYITDSGQYVEYMEQEQPSDCINLAVVYSKQSVDENKLRDWHEVSGICDCVLWINLQNSRQTAFYALPRKAPSPLSSRFPHKLECSALCRSEALLSDSNFSSRVQNGWIPFDDETSNRKISFDFVKRLFKQLQRVQMLTDCCVAVTYYMGNDPVEENAITLLNEPFITIRVLTPRHNSIDADAEFFNTPHADGAIDEKPKFVFLFSGGDIDVQRIQARLFGRTAMLALNTEDAQHFRLCNLFKT